tara:strand:+ start:1971 stop:2450 length:480 start_codon:yes stop_codon:yes gene_type:complete
MVVAEVLTGIALVQQSVAFIKSNIGTVQDIGQIAGQIDDLFRGEKEAQQARNKKAGGSLGSQFGVDTVAKEVIDAKLAAEKLQEVASMVDMRFGHGTWKSIVDERAKRIQEAKEAAAAVKRKKLEEARAFEEAVKQVALAATVIIVSIVLFVFLFGMIL